MRTFIALALILVACGLSAAQQRDIAQTAATIASCQAVGRECKADGGADCYGRYDSCMAEGGLRD